ncbi:MAG: NTP transferase domain-containing protein [Patescibacteria group bacterium]
MFSNREIPAIVLAGGRGTRMGKGLPKILRPLCGRPLIFWILDTLKQCGLKNIIMVIGYKAKLTGKSVKDAGYKKTKFVKQDRLLGTAHAVGVGLSVVPETAEDTLVLFGDDSALYRPATLDNFIKYHQENHAKATVLTVISDVPTSLGGLRKDDLGRIVGVVSKQEMQEKGINRHSILCGALCFETKWIKEILKKIPKNEVSGEYLLPGFMKIAAERGEFTQEFILPDAREWTSINSLEDLNIAEMLKLEFLNERSS